MFCNSIFNQPFDTNGDNWNVSNVERMDYMFRYAYSFNQCNFTKVKI